MVFIADKTVWSMPERFKVVCIPCKALYKCSAFLFNQRRSNVQATHIRRRSPTSMQRRALNVASICKINTISTESRRQITTYFQRWSNGGVPIGLRLNIEKDLGSFLQILHLVFSWQKHKLSLTVNDVINPRLFLSTSVFRLQYIRDYHTPELQQSPVNHW